MIYGSWQGFKGAETKLISDFGKKLNSYTLKNVKEQKAIGENGEDSASKLKVKGFPFQKSCTIYRGNDTIFQ